MDEGGPASAGEDDPVYGRDLRAMAAATLAAQSYSRARADQPNVPFGAPDDYHPPQADAQR